MTQTVFSFHNKLRLFKKDLQTKTFAFFKCLKKISESLPNIPVKTEGYLCKMSGLAEEINRRFNDLRSLKSSFSFLENPFAVNVVSDVCESLYSNLKFIKSKHRSELNDEHLSELVRTALTNYQPVGFKILTEKMNTRKSTSHK